jgi:DNA-binding NarL/FixJ family response regulator
VIFTKQLEVDVPVEHLMNLGPRNHIGIRNVTVLAFVGQRMPADPDPAFDALSRRERETLALLADGLSNAEIAERLGISEKTVRNHLSNLFDKLGVWSRAQAIVFARDHGFSG